MIVVACLLALSGVPDFDVASHLAATLSTPRVAMDETLAAGLTGLAFLTVHGPIPAADMEPWLVVPRLPWLWEGLGWRPKVLHHGNCRWDEARAELALAASQGRPGIWVWSDERRTAWGTVSHPPPEGAGCFAVVVGEGGLDPWPVEKLMARALLEAVSQAYAASSKGLWGLESLHDPTTAQGLSAYARLHADIASGLVEPPSIPSLAAAWAHRCGMAAGFLRRVAGELEGSQEDLWRASWDLDQERVRCLMPLAAASTPSPAEACSLVWQALSWHRAAFEALQTVALAASGLDSAWWPALRAPDEPPGDREALFRLCGHPEPAIRRMALRKLAAGACADEACVRVVRTALDDDDALVREAALAAMDTEVPVVTREILWEAYQREPPRMLHGNGSFRRALLISLASVAEAEVPGLLVKAGSLCESGCRPLAIPTWAAEGLVDLLGEASWPFLKALLQAPCPSARWAAATSLAQLSSPEAREWLLAIADRDTVPEVRCAALGALGRAGDEQAVRRLLAMVEHPSADVRLAAASALVEAGSQWLSLLEEHLGTLRAHSPAASLLRQVVQRLGRT